MAINFPNSPANGDSHVSGDKTFEYNASKGVWNLEGSLKAALDITSTPPSSPLHGDLWMDEATGDMYTYFTDADSSQWIQVNGVGAVGAGGGSGGATVYANMAELIAVTGMSNGDFGLVVATNKLYVYYGAWFLVSNLTNSPPTSITGNAATYQLAQDGTPTVITLASTDPEGFPITWSHSVTTGSLGSTATVSQNNNVFTVTPSSTEADAGSFTLTFTANDGVNQITTTSDFVLQFAAPPASVLFTTVGTHTWTAPAGVTSVSAVVIGGGANGSDGGGILGGGGGALAWKNNITVVPGNTYNVVVGAGSVHDSDDTVSAGGYSLFKDQTTVYATGGQSFNSTTAQPVGDRYYTGDGGGLGGVPAQGGSGAGGYSGNGGTGGDYNANGSSGSGGGGGGGGGRDQYRFYIAGGGGGVGVYGEGTSGSGGATGYPGVGGSGGSDGGAGYQVSSAGYGGDGGLYGGGGAAGQNTSSYAMGGSGANGAVRIIWGVGRAFPSTNVDLASSTSGETTV